MSEKSSPAIQSYYIHFRLLILIYIMNMIVFFCFGIFHYHLLFVPTSWFAQAMLIACVILYSSFVVMTFSDGFNVDKLLEALVSAIVILVTYTFIELPISLATHVFSNQSISQSVTIESTYCEYDAFHDKRGPNAILVFHLHDSKTKNIYQYKFSFRQCGGYDPSKEFDTSMKGQPALLVGKSSLFGQVYDELQTPKGKIKQPSLWRPWDSVLIQKRAKI